MNKIIGIDIDGVLTDLEEYQIEKGKLFFKDYNKDVINSKGYETTDIFGVDNDFDDLFWNKHFKDYSMNVDARKGASDTISKLKIDGYQIFIITARGSWLPTDNSMSLDECKNIVIDWLDKNNIEYDKIIFSKEDKLDVCTNNIIDIMIEDKVDNINKISTKLPVICFNAGYNEECNGNNIYRAYNWNDVYNIIKKIL